ncbi:hypothetical protein T439DRAFT_155779 [Meredithblackwellia eburnea MCA 4105]
MLRRSMSNTSIAHLGEQDEPPHDPHIDNTRDSPVQPSTFRSPAPGSLSPGTFTREGLKNLHQFGPTSEVLSPPSHHQTLQSGSGSQTIHKGKEPAHPYFLTAPSSSAYNPPYTNYSQIQGASFTSFKPSQIDNSQVGGIHFQQEPEDDQPRFVMDSDTDHSSSASAKDGESTAVQPVQLPKCEVIEVNCRHSKCKKKDSPKTYTIPSFFKHHAKRHNKFKDCNCLERLVNTISEAFEEYSCDFNKEKRILFVRKALGQVGFRYQRSFD